MDSIVAFDHVSKAFGKHKVIKDLSLQINRGEVLGLVGKSGGGKSTLMRLLMGFYRADSGEIIFNGKKIGDDVYHLRQNVGFTTQENSFYPKLTVSENLLYFAQMYDVSVKETRSRIPQLLTLVKLEGYEKTKAGELSGGMKRRLDFAISLAHDPALMILDEPTTGLDPILRDEIWSIIWDIQRYGKTVLVSTHFFDELQKHCHRIAILHQGRISMVASPQWYKQQYFEDFAKSFAYIIHFHESKSPQARPRLVNHLREYLVRNQK